MPITPTIFNGLAPCGSGSLTSGCVCCPNADGQIACQTLLQECVIGLDNQYTCVTSPQFTPSCASKGLVNCGTGCMPSGATCCSGQNDWCSAGYQCGTSSHCIPDTSPTATVPVLGSATTKITATSATTTMSAFSSPTNKNTATSSTSANPSQSASSVATRKGYGRISSLVTMVAVNVFIFPWL
jgi:hypothetical protein